MLLVVCVVAVVVAVATYLTWVAGRLDRLAIRVEGSWDTLDTQLSYRALAAHELAHVLGEPALHAAARAAGSAVGADREVAESRLSRALQHRPALVIGAGSSVSGEPDAATVGSDLDASMVKVALARQFYNDAVRDLMVLRGRRVVRVLHLYGRAQAPAYFEFDSSVPDRTA